MRVVVQRVRRPSVRVDDRDVAADRPRLPVAHRRHPRATTEAEARKLAVKTARLRVFDDEAGLMNLALADVGGEVLAVSQFTLYADARKGNRPSFTGAAGPEQGERLYEAYVRAVRAEGVPVQTGIFGAHMQVELVNDGPVTILLEA